MSYPIDHPLLRLTGELLAAGSGTFGEREIRRLFDGALEDDTLYRAETAALLVAYVTVHPLADAYARQRFSDVADGARDDDPNLEDWIVRSFSRPLLHRAAALVAGRGSAHRVSKADVLTLLDAAFHGGPGPARAITPDESMAFLVIRQLLDGHLTPEARGLLDEMYQAITEDGYSIGPSRPPSAGAAPYPGSGTRQCGRCAGMGSVTCGACGGHGYHRRTTTRTRHDGSTEYDEAQTPCSCAGGWTPCGQCGGSGRV
jgi:hypothetical protein